MATIKVLVLRTAGINCDQETAHAFNIAGATSETHHVNELIKNPSLLNEFQILALPGGFSYGDDIASGRILANQILHHFYDAIIQFVSAGKLVIGICNGFQVLVKTGLLPGCDVPDDKRTQATVTHNDSGKFEDRWVYLKPATDKCVFITPGQQLYLPVAHGEGKVYLHDDIAKSVNENQIAFRYVDSNGHFGGYPINPNGAPDHIAGLCDTTGQIFGLMPHPERHIHKTHHPRWTRNEGNETPDGLTIFRNAVNYFA